MEPLRLPGMEQCGYDDSIETEEFVRDPWVHHCRPKKGVDRHLLNGKSTRTTRYALLSPLSGSFFLPMEKSVLQLSAKYNTDGLQ